MFEKRYMKRRIIQIVCLFIALIGIIIVFIVVVPKEKFRNDIKTTSNIDEICKVFMEDYNISKQENDLEKINITNLEVKEYSALFYEYLDDVLIPEKGLSKTNINYYLNNDDEFAIGYKNEQDCGVASAYISDLNDDGIPEMLVTETRGDISYLTKYWIYLYGIDNDEVVLISKIETDSFTESSNINIFCYTNYICIHEYNYDGNDSIMNQLSIFEYNGDTLEYIRGYRSKAYLSETKRYFVYDYYRDYISEIEYEIQYNNVYESISSDEYLSIVNDINLYLEGLNLSVCKNILLYGMEHDGEYDNPNIIWITKYNTKYSHDNPVVELHIEDYTNIRLYVKEGVEIEVVENEPISMNIVYADLVETYYETRLSTAQELGMESELFFSLYDINGDGVDDLICGINSGQYIDGIEYQAFTIPEIYTYKNNNAVLIYKHASSGIWWKTTYRICENDLYPEFGIISMHSSGTGYLEDTYYSMSKELVSEGDYFYPIETLERETLPDEESTYWHTMMNIMPREKISENEYESIKSSYKPILLNLIKINQESIQKLRNGKLYE